MMSEYTDNLIAEAIREAGRIHLIELEREDWDAIIDAAVDAVQPVTPDRETLAKALYRLSYPNNEPFEHHSASDMLKRADALLASGVLGQPQPHEWAYDGTAWVCRAHGEPHYREEPQPQPDRETLAIALYTVDNPDTPVRFQESSVSGEYLAQADALLPLLGQPRTDEKTQKHFDAVLHERVILTGAVDQAINIIDSNDPAVRNRVRLVLDEAREEVERLGREYRHEPRTDAPLDPEPCKHEDTFEDGTQRFCSDCAATIQHFNADADDWIPGPPDSDLRWTDEGFRARYPRTDTTEPGDKP